MNRTLEGTTIPNIISKVTNVEKPKVMETKNFQVGDFIIGATIVGICLKYGNDNKIKAEFSVERID